MYSLQSVQGQASLGPGPSSMMFFKNQTNPKITPNPPIYIHFR